MSRIAFTICSRNYTAQALTLVQSLARTDPDTHRLIVFSDGPPEGSFDSGGAEIRDGRDFCPALAEMVAYYTTIELNTALKPFVFRHLLEQPGVQSVVYLDPDIVAYRPLDTVWAALERADIALTPHLRAPLAEPGSPDDHIILRSGVYNLGFLGLRAGQPALRFADWWADRCRFDCRVAFEEGLFTDQRWVDMAPGFFEDVAILRSATLNLAYWNLPHTALEQSAGAWFADGAPLAFFHFSGFDPHRPDLLSRHQDRVRVEGGSPLARILEDYAARLLSNGYARWSSQAYGYGAFASGRPVTALMRRLLLRRAREGHEVDLGAVTAEEIDAPDPTWSRPDLPQVTNLMAQVWRETPGAETSFPPHSQSGRHALHAYFQSAGERLGADHLALSAARACLDGSRVAESTGSARPGSLAALAQSIGPEAPEGALAAERLDEAGWARLLAEDPRRVCAWAEPSRAAGPSQTSREGASVCLAFGVSERAQWPDTVRRGLREPLGRPGEIAALGRLPALADTIWRSRTDLQRTFDLRRSVGRIRYARWLARVGVAEYGLERSALPGRLIANPVFRWFSRPRP